MFSNRYLFSIQLWLDEHAPFFSILTTFIVMAIFASYAHMLATTFVHDFFHLLWCSLFVYALIKPKILLTIGSIFALTLALMPSRWRPRNALAVIPVSLCMWTLMVKSFYGHYQMICPTFSDLSILIWGHILFGVVWALILLTCERQRLFFFLIFINSLLYFTICNGLSWASTQVVP